MQRTDDDSSSTAAQVSTELNTPATDNLVSKPKQWFHPKPFKDESQEAKVSIILKWIFGPVSLEGIITGKKKITNFTIQLENMKFNGYLRLFEIDTNILLKWKCERCLFWYHGKCTKERKIKRKEIPGDEYSLCDSCFFAL